MGNAYKVKLDIFEGPFDLLVFLIKQSKMSIYDIEISTITDQYLSYLKNIRTPEPEFLVLAATLIEIKSKKLLPRSGDDDVFVDENDEIAAELEKEALVKRLETYNIYVRASNDIEKMLRDGGRIFTKKAEETRSDDDVSINNFNEFIATLSIKNEKKSETKEQYLKKDEKISMINKIRELKNVFSRKIFFRQIFNKNPDKHNVIITFLAVLEMLKLGMIKAKQERNFSDILIKPREGLNKNG